MSPCNRLAGNGARSTSAGNASAPPGDQKDDGKPGESLRAVQWERYRARLAEAQRQPAAALEAYRDELGDRAE